MKTTKEIAIDFVSQTLTSINRQLKTEIERNGFKKSDIDNGKLKLNRTLKISKDDPRFIAELYSIKVNNFDRPIMSVKWSPTGFIIERHSDSVANAIKTSPNFLTGKNRPKLDLSGATQREIDIEALANKKLLKNPS